MVVLTSPSDAPTRLEGAGDGRHRLPAKPVDESELVLRVRNTLNAKAYRTVSPISIASPACPTGRC